MIDRLWVWPTAPGLRLTTAQNVPQRRRDPISNDLVFSVPVSSVFARQTTAKYADETIALSTW